MRCSKGTRKAKSTQTAVSRERQRAVIVDLDGTLCNDSSRKHLVEGKHRDYDAYHAALMSDEPNPKLLSKLDAFTDEGVLIFYITGRPEKYRSLTLDWFMLHDVPPGMLFMKPDNNVMQKAADFKREVIERELKSLDIGFAFDDNDRVLEMLKGLGIETVKVDANART